MFLHVDQVLYFFYHHDGKNSEDLGHLKSRNQISCPRFRLNVDYKSTVKALIAKVVVANDNTTYSEYGKYKTPVLRYRPSWRQSSWSRQMREWDSCSCTPSTNGHVKCKAAMEEELWE